MINKTIPVQYFDALIDYAIISLRVTVERLQDFSQVFLLLRYARVCSDHVQHKLRRTYLCLVQRDDYIRLLHIQTKKKYFLLLYAALRLSTFFNFLSTFFRI